MKLKISLLFILCISWKIGVSQDRPPYEIRSQIEDLIEAKEVYDYIQNRLDTSGYVNYAVLDLDAVKIPFNCHYELEYNRIDSIEFPLESYYLLEVRRTAGKVNCNDGRSKIKFATHRTSLNPIIYIFAVDENTKRVKGIYGNIFLNRYSRYYSFPNQKDVKSYLELWFYCKEGLVEVSDIQIIENEISARVFLKNKKEFVRVRFSKANPDLVTIVSLDEN